MVRWIDGDVVNIIDHILSIWSIILTMCVCVCMCVCRQCALVALQDVRSYLKKEGGQIAVSLQILLPASLYSHKLDYTH